MEQLTGKHERRFSAALLSVIALAGLDGCKPAVPPPPQAMPVMVAPVALTPVPTVDTYVSTIKSRRSASMSSQVDGNITRILVTSGQAVKAGQELMQIDPLRQVAAVQQQAGSQAQSNAAYQFNKGEVDRQKRLFDAGITSKQAYDTAVQSFGSSKAAYDASAAGTQTQRAQLAYFQIRAPFAGVVGDIPVHVGDHVSAASGAVLTTVDDPGGLEAYIYLPTERVAQVKMGLPVEILDTAGVVLAKTTISFLSPEVDNGIQGILAKATVPAASKLRNFQVVNARVTWSSTPTPTVPVLAVTQIGGQSFVYLAVPPPPALAGGAGGPPPPAGSGPKPAFVAHLVAVSVGQIVGNNYPVLKGLKQGDQVIVSGLQFIGEGAPVAPMHGPPGKPQGD